MKAIHKHPLVCPGRTSVMMPAGVEILSVQMQPSQGVMVWYQFTTGAAGAAGAPGVQKHFVAVGTGQEFHLMAARYLATVQEGGLVWHIFEDLGE